MNIKSIFFVLFVWILLAGCGGGTGQNGVGTTVQVTAVIKDGTSISSAVAVGTPGSFGTGTLSYNFQSTVLPHPNSIVASPVTLTTARISYVPLPDSAGNLSPSLPSFTKAIGVNVPAGGTGAVDSMIITSSTVLQYLYDNFVAPPTGLLNVPGMQFNYVVVVNFTGYEVNSGAAINPDAAVGNLFITK